MDLKISGILRSGQDLSGSGLDLDLSLTLQRQSLALADPILKCAGIDPAFAQILRLPRSYLFSRCLQD